MVRTAAGALRAALPDIDGWDLLGLAALGLFFYGLTVTFSLGIACVVSGALVMLMVFFVALRRAPVVTATPPGDE